MSKKFTIIFVLAIIAIVVVGFSLNRFYLQKETPKKNASTDPSWGVVKNKGKLIVGTDVPYGFMEFLDEDGNIVGLDIDIINEISKRIGVVAEIRDIDWDNLFESVKSKEIDVAIAGISITDERKKDFLFSAPYNNAGQVIIVKKENENIKLPTDLADKKVGSQKETTCIEAAAKYVKPENLKAYDSFEDSTNKGVFYDLKKGEIDAVVIGYEAAVGVIKSNPALKIASDPFTEDFSGIITNLENISLMSEIDKALRDMNRDGKLKEIERKWFIASQ